MKTLPKIRSALTGALLLFLAACSGEQSDSGQSPDIHIQNAYIVAPIGARNVTLGGLEITAKGEPVRLLGASSPAAERIEIHTTTQDETGRMRMRRQDGLTIAPDQAFLMGSGEPHFMVFGFDKSLKPGDSVELALRYTQADQEENTYTVTAVITEIGAEPTAKGS